MKFATLSVGGRETATVFAEDGRLLTVEEINRETGENWPTDLFALIQDGKLDEFTRWYGGLESVPGSGVPPEEAVYELQGLRRDREP